MRAGKAVKYKCWFWSFMHHWQGNYSWPLPKYVIHTHGIAIYPPLHFRNLFPPPNEPTDLTLFHLWPVLRNREGRKSTRWINTGEKKKKKKNRFLVLLVTDSKQMEWWCFWARIRLQTNAIVTLYKKKKLHWSSHSSKKSNHTVQ